MPGLFINARVDVLLRKLVSHEKSVDEIAARAKRYRDAGADGIFVPMIAGIDDIRAVVERIDPMPLNAMAIPSLPPASELRRVGVRRLSAGAGIARAVLGLIKELATQFFREGDSAKLLERAVRRTSTRCSTGGSRTLDVHNVVVPFGLDELPVRMNTGA